MSSQAIPPIRFARAGESEIAYQLVGDKGPVLVATPGFAQNIGLIWDEPRAARFLRRLGSFCRFIHFDKRGTGLSGRGGQVTSFPDRVRDFEAVLDAEHLDEAFVGGVSDGGSMAMYFAATQPQRCRGLVLYSTFPCAAYRDDLPWNSSVADLVEFGESWAAAWGRGEFSVEMMAPSLAGDTSYIEWMSRYEQQSLTPRGFADLWDMVGTIDVRNVLSSIQGPTTIVHRIDDTMVDFQTARYLADHIPNARLIELAGRDHLPWIGDQDAVLDVIEEVVTGASAHRRIDRMLAVLLFTDIVESTRQAVALGDAEWRYVLDTHDQITATAAARHGGRIVKTTGDGALAIFTNPSDALHASKALHRQLAAIGVPIRVGLHAGEIERRGDDVSGVGVHLAARICAQAGSGQTVVSGTIKDLTAGAGFRFMNSGLTELKGIDQPWALFVVEDE